MRKLKYFLMFVLSVTVLSSCFEDSATDLLLNDDGLNVVTFDRIIANLSATADGSEVDFEIKVKMVGPTMGDLTSDITVDMVVNEATTAVEGSMYKINNLPLTLKAKDNYLGILSITLVTLDNDPPLEGTPEYAAWDSTYVTPMLYLDIVTTGDANVAGSGKTGEFSVNFIAPNPYAGDYDAHILYYHPSVGEYPDNVMVEETTLKPLIAVTGRKSETGFGVWAANGYLAWITVNSDNSATYVGDSDAWGLDIIQGDPHDASKVSHFDPATGIIYVYYHYMGGSGYRIFWETFTPRF